MNSRERVRIAMQLGKPDRIPVWCLLSLEHIIAHAMPEQRIPVTIEELVEAEVGLAKRYGFDGTLVYLPGTRRGAGIEPFIRKAISDVPVGDASHDFATSDPDSWALDLPEYDEGDFYSSRLAREIGGDDLHIGGWVADGFSRAIQWFPTLEEALMATIQDPPRFQALVHHFDQLSIDWAVNQIRLGGIESIQISSPYAGASFISSTAYEQYVLPSVSKVAAAITATGAFSYIHTCGVIGDRLQLLVDSGSEGIECMDPPPLGNVTLEQAKAQVGAKIFLKGNIDSVNVLLAGTGELVESTIKETIAAGKPDGGYILSTACSVAPKVKPERVQQMARLAEEFGQY